MIVAVKFPQIAVRRDLHRIRVHVEHRALHKVRKHGFLTILTAEGERHAGNAEKRVVQALSRAGVEICRLDAAHLGEIGKGKPNGFAAVAVGGKGHDDAKPRFKIRGHAQLGALDLDIRIAFAFCHLKAGELIRRVNQKVTLSFFLGRDGSEDAQTQ